ncbi:hypothetical protein KSP39_PZI014545 [Platanthera zijinensis]|uniref:Uncharacterized protein n=1 Tax=Platanthera zijinensis TaxID=2320716 RepID=A0AAP0BAY3_9ASPA
MIVNGYIYVWPGVVNMLRSFTGQVELVRPAVTRFATSFLIIQHIHKQKNNLRMMFTSPEWSSSKWAKESGGKQVQSIILMIFFWRSIVDILKIFGPLVRVLRLVDGEKRPVMGYIYEAMDRAKETIISHYLNPEYFYYNPTIAEDGEIMEGLYKTMQRLIPNHEEQDKIIDQLTLYRNAEGLFGMEFAIRHRKIKSPGKLHNIQTNLF